MTEVCTAAPAEAGPEFSSHDVFRLQTATYLSIVQVLNDAGLVSLPEMAEILEGHVDASDPAAWAQVARAFVQVMRRDAPPDDAAPASRTVRAFRVIEGGRGR